MSSEMIACMSTLSSVTLIVSLMPSIIKAGPMNHNHVAGDQSEYYDDFLARNQLQIVPDENYHHSTSGMTGLNQLNEIHDWSSEPANTFRHYLPEVSEPIPTVQGQFSGFDGEDPSISLSGSLATSSSDNASQAVKGKVQFRCVSLRKFRWINKRMGSTLKDEKELEQLLANGHPLACQLYNQYKKHCGDIRERSILRHQLRMRPNDEDLRSKAASLRETMEDLMRDKKKESLLHTMSETRRQALRDVYRKLQADIRKYNATGKTKQRYLIEGHQKIRLEAIKEEEIEPKLVEGNAEADEMVRRIQNVREQFCLTKCKEQLIPEIQEIAEWLNVKGFRCPPLILPRDMLELKL